MSAATRSGRTRRAPVPDRLCAEAVGLARDAVESTASPGTVGEYLEAVADGDRVVTHFFECLELAYRGWRWAATVTRASRAKVVTLDETVLLPGPDAVLAPEWVPWHERLRPGDLGPGDLLPTEPDDLRLEPGFSGEDEPPPNSPVAQAAAGAVHAPAGPDVTDAAGISGAADTAGTADIAGTADSTGAEGTSEDHREAQREITPPPSRAAIASVAEEMGMGRPRVLSRYGLHIAADRWEEEYGSQSPMAQAAPATCVSCGFLVRLAGSLRQAFGVCANEFSPADGHVVSFSYGCGGHSEAAVMPKSVQPPPPVIDETRADDLELRGPGMKGVNGEGGLNGEGGQERAEGPAHNPHNVR
jgi:hypothetical protein